MKIKTNKSNKINYSFGLALLTLILMFVFALSKNGLNTKSTAHDILHAKDIVTQLPPFAPELLELQINNESFNQIKLKREEALSKGLLFTSKKDFVPADIRISEDSYGVDIRLKGDLLDHLKANKWSYRIKLKDDKTWKGMTEFSIHNSRARSHLAEWYMHELFKQEGIMTPLYGFIELKQNGKAIGVYAYEEHFTDALLLRNERQVAPILKHVDDGYWENVQKNIKPFYWTKTLDIDLFNQNHDNDIDFMKSYESSKSRLQQFLDSDIEAAAVFDVDKMAKYYALMELSHAFHAQQITNIRFYVNPLSGLLEPIAFDCFGEELPAVTESWEAAGQGINSKVSPREDYPYGGVYMHLLFQDYEFFERYMSYLDKYTKVDFLSKVKDDFSTAINDRQKFIRSDEEYSAYEFSFERLFKKSEFTRKKILPLPQYSLKVFTDKNSRRNLKLKSFHYFPLEIIGFGNENELLYKLNKPLILEAYHKEIGQEIYSISNIKEQRFLYYKTLGTDSVFIHEIKENSIPQEHVKSTEKDLSFWLKSNILGQLGDTLSFISDETILSHHLFIPEGFILSIAPGQDIYFKAESSINSESPILAEAEITNPIRFIGDGSAKQGIIINNKSIFRHCVFETLSGLSHKGIFANSGLTISASSTLSNCSFNNSIAQHALSLNHGDHSVEDISISNSTGHGLKLFYANASIDNMSFSSVPGNALVSEYSQIELQNLNFNKIDGSAILASHSKVIELDSILINNSFQGLVLQNNRTINCSHLELNHLQNGILVQAAELKESLFVGREIQFEHVEKEIINDLYSTVLIDDKKIVN